MKKIILILLGASFFTCAHAQWKLTGNLNTNPKKNWVGTNDDQPLNFRVNSEEAGTINKDKGNTAFGYLAFNNGIYSQNPINISNTAFGAWALQKNNQSDYNTAIGSNALRNNINGYGNVAVGFSALGTGSSGYGNTAIGYHALDAEASNYNTAIGFESMLYNKNGYENVAIGFWALLGRTTNAKDSLREGNTGCGDNALQNIDNQRDNAAFGQDAIRGDTTYGTGNNNSSLGTLSLINNYGDNNSALGYSAGYNNTSGTGNLFLGANADIVSGNNISGAAAIGAGAIVSASNKMQLGSSATILSTTGGYTIVSDKRFKQNIEDKKVPGLNFIDNLHPVTYTFNYKSFDDFLRKKNKITDENYQNQLLEKSKIQQTGFIAQEVDQLVKDSGFVFNGVYEPQNNNDNYALDYSRFVVPLVKAVQELSSQNDIKQEQIDSLKQSNQALNDKLNTLSDKINQVENAMSQCCNSFSSSMQSYDNSQAQSITINAAASLNQNVPNPFNSSSSISYYIPSGSHNAELMITDASGKTLKTYSITQSGSGKQIITGRELTSGMYQYSLLVDGKIIDTKKMILSK